MSRFTDRINDLVTYLNLQTDQELRLNIERTQRGILKAPLFADKSLACKAAATVVLARMLQMLWTLPADFPQAQPILRPDWREAHQELVHPVVLEASLWLCQLEPRTDMLGCVTLFTELCVDFNLASDS